MVKHFYFGVFFLVACRQPAGAQAAHDQAEARALYQQANAHPGLAMRALLQQHAAGFLGQGAFQLGALRTYDGRRRPVPGLRYHTGLRLLEAQDSLNTDSTHLWPVGSLRGFDLGEADDPASPLRRFRARLVKEGSAGTRREFVEVLTAIDAGPLLLAWLYQPPAGAAGPGRAALTGTLMAGPGAGSPEPLRPLEPTQAVVLRLFGARADEVRSFVSGQHLDYTRPADIARMMDHYNRVVVVK
ncbi:MAG: hypothetical protein NVSMB30_11500 [Hymenobacter sp.]